jgi:hypothetical protein
MSSPPPQKVLEQVETKLRNDGFLNESRNARAKEQLLRMQLLLAKTLPAKTDGK